MSILVIRGPEMDGSGTCMPRALPRDVLGGLVDKAVRADKTIAVRSCGSENDVLLSLEMANRSHAEIVLLDPGSCAKSQRLESALQRLGTAYIEVHDDSCDCPEAVIALHSSQRLALVNGYMAQSYTLALDIALEHLGCAESLYEFHVGT